MFVCLPTFNWSLNLHSLPFHLSLWGAIGILSLCPRVPSDTCFYPHAQNNKLSHNPQGLLLQALSNLLRMPWQPVNAPFTNKEAYSPFTFFCLSVLPLTLPSAEQRREQPAGWLLAKVSSFRGFCLQSARNQSSCQSTYCTWGQHSVRLEQQATEEEQRTVPYLRPIPLISEHFHKPFNAFLSLWRQVVHNWFSQCIYELIHSPPPSLDVLIFFFKEITLDGDLMESGAVLDSRHCE